MNGLSVVKRYAKALFDAAESASGLSELKADMAALDELFGKMPELKRFCLSPGSPEAHERTRAFIETAFLPYLNSLTARTVEILERNSRLEALPYLSRALRALFDRKEGIQKVLVESASEVDTDLKQEISARMEKRLDSKVKMEWQILPSLLGGMRFHWQNYMLDMSIRGRLAGMKNSLKRNST